MEQVGWCIEYEDDIASDLSAFHRVDDWEALDAPRYFSLAVRIGAYDGVIAARLEHERERENPQRFTGEQATEVPESVLLARVAADGWTGPIEHDNDEG